MPSSTTSASAKAIASTVRDFTGEWARPGHRARNADFVATHLAGMAYRNPPPRQRAGAAYAKDMVIGTGSFLCSSLTTCPHVPSRARSGTCDIAPAEVHAI